MKKSLLLPLLLLIAAPLYGAGGTCPSAQIYKNWQQPDAPATFKLSQFGITQCYYVSPNSGSDTNSGTTEGAPWAHVPGMTNCSNNCSSATPTAGTGFIVRVGDTFHYQTGGTLVGGTWTWSSTSWGTIGTTANPVYVGIDPAWCNGSCNLATQTHWAMNADNAITTSTTLPSCTYQIPGSNNMISLGGNVKNVIIDYIEMYGLCQSRFTPTAGADDYIFYGGFGGQFAVMNFYFHGWSHQQFGTPGDPISCVSGQTCWNEVMFWGNSGKIPGDMLINGVVDGSDSDPSGAGLCYADFWYVAYSYFQHVSNCITRNNHIFHDNAQLYWAENGHANTLEAFPDANQTNARYNNIVAHGREANTGIIWSPRAPCTSTSYIFNNVFFDNTGEQQLAIGTNSNVNPTGCGNGEQGPLIIFNNTIAQTNNGSPAVNCTPTGTVYPFTMAGNFEIADNGNPYGICKTASAQQGTYNSEFSLTTSAATSAGYTQSQQFAYSPTSAGSPTVGHSANLSNYCTALQTAANSDSYLNDSVVACQQDSRYACIYNTSNHTVSCPARTANARPAAGSGNWDYGYLEFQSGGSGGGGTAPPAPATLTATGSGPNIGLVWGSSMGAGTYSILRSTTHNGPYTQIASVSSSTLTYTDTNLAFGQYFYVVQAVNTSGSSPNSPEANANSTNGFVLAFSTTSPSVVSSAVFAVNGTQFAADTDVCFVSWNDTTHTITGISDTSSNAYNSVGSFNLSGSFTTALYISPNIKASTTNQVTITWSGAVSAPELRCEELNGPYSIDNFNGASGTGTAMSTGNISVTGGLDMLVAATVSAQNPTPGTGFTLRAGIGGDVLEDQYITTNGTYQGTASQSPSGTWLIVGAALLRSPILAPSATNINFGSQASTTTSPPTYINYTNIGGVTTTLNTPFFVIGGANPTDFAETATGSTCSNGLVMAPNASCIAGYTFTPAAAANYAATVTVSGSGSASTVIQLAGTGTAASIASSPTITPNGGTFSSAQNPVVNSSTSGAYDCIRTDGGVPNSDGAGGCQFGTKITNNTSVSIANQGQTTLTAIAAKVGLTDSAVTTAIFNINFGTAVAPTVSLAGGSYIGGPQVPTLTSPTPTAVICVGVGVTPTAATPGSCDPGFTTVTNGGTYSFNTSLNLRAIATAIGYVNSSVTSVNYNLFAGAPILSPNGGLFTASVVVTFTNSTSSNMCVTQDGSTPTGGGSSCTNGTLVANGGTLTITPYTQVYAISISTTYQNSALSGGTYTPFIPATAVQFAFERETHEKLENYFVWRARYRGHSLQSGGRRTRRQAVGLPNDYGRAIRSRCGYRSNPFGGCQASGVAHGTA